MKMSLLERLFVNSSVFDVWRKWTARRLLKHVQKNHKKVLEIGCGKGTTTQIIAEVLPRAKIIATDFDNAQVKRAKENLHPFKNIRVAQADASQLSFKDESFDAVFAFLTFHHIGEWKKAQQECFRVLKKGSYLYIDELELKPFPKLQHFFLPTTGIFSRTEFVENLKRVGFRVKFLKHRYKFALVARKL